jgi:hypothetical protein
MTQPLPLRPRVGNSQQLACESEAFHFRGWPRRGLGAADDVRALISDPAEGLGLASSDDRTDGRHDHR